MKQLQEFLSDPEASAYIRRLSSFPLQPTLTPPRPIVPNLFRLLSPDTTPLLRPTVLLSPSQGNAPMEISPEIRSSEAIIIAPSGIVMPSLDFLELDTPILADEQVDPVIPFEEADYDSGPIEVPFSEVDQEPQEEAQEHTTPTSSPPKKKPSKGKKVPPARRSKRLHMVGSSSKAPVEPIFVDSDPDEEEREEVTSEGESAEHTPTAQPSETDEDVEPEDETVVSKKGKRKMTFSPPSKSRGKSAKKAKRIVEDVADSDSKLEVLRSVTYVKPYVAKIVKQFYANLSHDFANPSSKLYGKVFVRGKIFTVTPARINKFLGAPNVIKPDEEVDEKLKAQMVNVLTGGQADVWVVNKRPNRIASVLTSLFSTLHKISVSNWIPTSNSTMVPFEHVCLLYKVFKGKKFNLRSHNFNSIAEVAMTKSNKKLVVPSLIYSMLLEQGLKTRKKDVLTSRLPLQTVQPAFLSEKRTRDLPWFEEADDDVPSSEFMCSIPVFVVQEQIAFFTSQITLLEGQMRIF
ncbi:hypothetical protein C2S51_025219 [Perilla frutescens var. frutescens]|nr:hypothetical protein C2S51_025219 [Perilla frutescens var. frutescens]